MSAQQKVFQDIATRTNGDIYIGVVGPVRCGKSTFITRFMQNVVIPRISDANEIARVTDELPQSADGIGIMTTQPKFVPATATQIKVGTAKMRVRMLDCVGYIVPGASGHVVDGKPRNVKTPWSDNEMTFEKAAEHGTRKVIKEHSTIAIVMTTDGTATSLPRESYVEAEDKVIAQVKKTGKPFVVILNTRNVATSQTIAGEIAAKHGAVVLPIDVEKLNADNVNDIFSALLAEFQVTGFRVNMPKWLTVLPDENEIISEAIDTIKKHTNSVKKMGDNNTATVFEKSAHFSALQTTSVEVATGVITYTIVPKDDLFYRVLSAQSGATIESDVHLVAFMRHLGEIRTEYDKLSSALAQAKETGYGVVEPTFSEFKLEEPALFKSGKSHGIKFRATAPSLHLVRVDVQTTVSPAIGGKAQSEEMLRLIKAEYDENPDQVWRTPIFGKSLESLVTEGIGTKVNAMSNEAKRKMKRTITKIVNNGRGGIICIVL